MSYSPNFRGIIGKGSSRQNQTGYQNGTGGTMPVATPVATNLSGQLVLMDVSDENTVETMLGLTSESIPSAANGQVVSEGRLENIPISLGFAVRDILYVGPTPGSLTNVKPDVSVPGWSAGMFVILVGVVVKNEFNPSNQDIQLFRQIIGQL